MEIEYCRASGYFVYFCLLHALYAFPLPCFLKISKNSLHTVDTLKNSHRGRTWCVFLDIGSRNRHVVESVIKLVSAAYWSTPICFFYGYVRAFAWSASLWTRRVNVSRFLLKNDGATLDSRADWNWGNCGSSSGYSATDTDSSVVAA